MQVDADGMARLGYLTKTGKDSYALPDAGTEEPREVEQAPAEEPFTDHLPEAVLNALTELDANLGSPAATDAAVAGVIARLAQDDVEGAVKSFTSRTGLDPETSRGYVEGMMHDARESIKARFETGFGIPDAEALLQHYEGKLSPAARSSMALELWAGSNAAFKRCADEFVRHMENAVVADKMYSKKTM
jgi:hypothetical protein